jgi:hypothetical protein
MRTQSILLSIAIALAAGQAAALPTSCVPAANQVAFFIDANFSGGCILRGPGEYPTPESLGLPNDSISSVKLGSGAQVILCRDNNYRGDCQLFAGNIANLGSEKIGNDTVSSAKVEARGTQDCKPGAQQVGFFMHGNYVWPCSLKGLGEFANAAAIGLPNDSVSSVLVGQGAWAILCVDDNFGGDCQRFTASDPHLDNSRIRNDRVSSAKVQRANEYDCNPTANQVAFFVHDDYIGPCSVRGFGDYYTPQEVGVPNDSTSSVMVGSGAQVVLYVDNSYGGDGEKFTASDPHLGDNKIRNDRVSSAHVQALGTVDCPSGANQVAVFMHGNFLAPCAVRGIGDYPKASAIGLSDNSISSIRVGSSVQACGYDSENFGGEVHTFTSDVAALGDFNDKISSLKVMARGAACPAAGGGTPGGKVDLLVVGLNTTPFETPTTSAICVQVTNSLSATAPAPSNQLRVTLTSSPAETGFPLTVYAPVPQLDPNTNANVCTQPVTLSGGHCYKFHICVDAANSVAETNEANNCYDWQVSYPPSPGGTPPPCR